MTTTRATAPLLHRFLGTGLVALGATLVFLRWRGLAPLSPADSVTPLIAYALTGLVAVLLAVALLVLKPRVAERRPGQSVEAYWASSDVTASVLPVWFVLEGAGVTANVSYFLTGEAVSAVAMVVAVTAFWWLSPNVFAKP